MKIERTQQHIVEQHRELIAASHESTAAAVDAKAGWLYFDGHTWPEYQKEMKNTMQASRLTWAEKMQMASLILAVVVAALSGFGWYINSNNKWMMTQMDTKIQTVIDHFTGGK